MGGRPARRLFEASVRLRGEGEDGHTNDLWSHIVGSLDWFEVMAIGHVRGRTINACLLGRHGTTSHKLIGRRTLRRQIEFKLYVDCQPNGLPELGKSAFYPHRQDEGDVRLNLSPRAYSLGPRTHGSPGSHVEYLTSSHRDGYMNDIPSVIRMSKQVKSERVSVVA